MKPSCLPSLDEKGLGPFNKTESENQGQGQAFQCNTKVKRKPFWNFLAIIASFKTELEIFSFSD